MTPDFVSDARRRSGRAASAIWDDIRAKDWSGTSLGEFSAWPVALRTILQTILASRQPICLWWGPDLRSFHNEAFVPILADREDGALGAPFSELWADISHDTGPLIDQALAGRGVWAEDMPLTMMRGGVATPTHWTFSYSPLYDDDGSVAGVLNIVTETTGAVEARRVQRIRTDALELALDSANEEIDHQRETARVRATVNRELSHRLKNSYAMVQAVVSQSIRNAPSLGEASEIIAARIQALAAAQDILTRSVTDEVDVAEIVTAALFPHQETAERIAIAGPAVRVSAQQGMGLALAVHELATNAAKYGGLSMSGGAARASWSADGSQFRFEWAEEGGPHVTRPTRKGFGTRLLERVIPSYFAGSGSLDYDGSGFRYALIGQLVAAPIEIRPPL